MSKGMVGSKVAERIISRYSSGREPQISMLRCPSRSSQPPEKPCIAPQKDAEYRPQAGQNQPEKDRDAKAIQQACEHVPATVVRA